MSNNPNKASREAKRSVRERSELDAEAIQLIRKYHAHMEMSDEHFRDWVQKYFGSYILRIGRIAGYEGNV
jgi:hypothetical protein